MLSYKKVDLDNVDNSVSNRLSSKSSELLRKYGTGYWSRMTGESLASDRLSSTIELGKERVVKKIEADYINFTAKLLLQSLCRLQETEVLMYVRDKEIAIMRALIIPWATEEYKSRTGTGVRVRIDHHFRLNDLFKGRVVISNDDRSLWVDNDVVAKVEDIAKNVLDRRDIKDVTKGSLKYMRR